MSPEEFQEATEDVLAVIFGHGARDLRQWDTASRYTGVRDAMETYEHVHARDGRVVITPRMGVAAEMAAAPDEGEPLDLTAGRLNPPV